LFSPGTPVSSTNKTDYHDITEILLKVVLNAIKQTNPPPKKKTQTKTKTRYKVLTPVLVEENLSLKIQFGIRRYLY
jgi:hypothetical protein